MLSSASRSARVTGAPGEGNEMGYGIMSQFKGATRHFSTEIHA